MLFRSLPDLDGWGTLVAWSGGAYLMAATLETWLDPDLVASLDARFAGDPANRPVLLTFDGLVSGDGGSGPGAEAIWLGLDHDRWSLRTGWGALPYAVGRLWLLRRFGLQPPGLDRPEPWRQALLADGLLPAHCAGLFVAAAGENLGDGQASPITTGFDPAKIGRAHV